jgi:hypothetical protein
MTMPPILVKLWAHVIGIMVTLLLATTLIFALLWRHERAAHFNASLRADSALAVADTSKRITDARVRKVLGDSTAAWQRRVVQEKQVADSLDKVLGTTRRSLTDIGVTIDRGTGKANSPVRVVYVPVRTPVGAPPESSDVRSAHFDTKAGVFGIVADVSLPAPPESGTMAATVTAPSIPLSLRLNCGPLTDGVARADAIVTGPAWATIGVQHVEAEPAICNPTMRLSKREYPLWVLVTSDILSAAAGYWISSKAQRITVVTK